MPKFAYISRDAAGQKVTAVSEAETRQNLISGLKNRGLTVVEVQELDEAPSRRRKMLSVPKSILKMDLLPKKISTSDQAMFWRQFATMIDSGLPVIEAMESITEEMDHAGFKKILQTVIADMWAGTNLSESLRKHPKVFPLMISSLIQAAEESGSLPEVANQIASFLENRDRLIRKVQAAMTYPVFLTAFFICVIAVATFWIIPKFRSIYAGFNAKMPAITQMVFDANAFFLSHAPWILLAIFAVSAGFVYRARTPLGKAAMDRAALRMPVFGRILQWAALVRFCRSLGILLFGGVAVSRALEMVEGVVGNSVIAKAIKTAREEIMKGGKIAASLKKQNIFPKMAVRMVAAGEETGNLTGLLEKTAEFYEARLDAVLTTINTLIEPIIIIVIGAFVLVFVLALYMPIFSLGASVKG